jgi:hypothetical protein
MEVMEPHDVEEKVLIDPAIARPACPFCGWRITPCVRGDREVRAEVASRLNDCQEGIDVRLQSGYPRIPLKKMGANYLTRAYAHVAKAPTYINNQQISESLTHERDFGTLVVGKSGNCPNKFRF